MSEDEDDYRYKNKNRKRSSLQSEEDEEEDENEENEEIEDESPNNINKNNNNIKKKNNPEITTIKIIPDKNNKNYNNNNNNNNKVIENKENIEEQHEHDLQINIKKSKKSAEYIAQIEELENELNLEKSINNKLKNSINQEEILKLKNDLNQKNLLLEKLISTNKKQKTALNILTKQLDKENKKRLKIKSPDPPMDTERSDKEVPKPDAVEIVLKVKDKELSNATIKMKVLKVENDGLKKILYENEDYNNNINMEDKAKEMNDKIQKCNNEKNLLLKQLKIHKKCIEEQTEYREQYDNLKLELKQTKTNIRNIINQTLQLINNNKKNENNSLYLGIHSQDSINNKYNSGTISSPNILSRKSKIKNQKKINIININKKKGVILPLISSQTINNQNESILTESFTKKIKEYLDNDEEEYNTLINKISNIENRRKILETKHKSEIKQFNSQIISLNEQFQLLNCDKKGTNSSIKVLKYKLNTIKGDNKQYSKKLNELKKELQEKINISNEKDYEISLLIGQINSLKNLANITNIEIPQDDISDYINKIKNEKIDEINEKFEANENKDEDNENNNENDNKNNDNRNKNQIEESIQADFPESDNEEYEEEEPVKINKKYKK